MAKRTNIAAAVAAKAHRDARDNDLDRRDAEHGGMRSLDIEVAEQQKREAMRGWSKPYKPDATRQEVSEARQGIVLPDRRRITLQRLYVDCGAAVRRFAPGFKRERAETLRNDALLLLVQWPRHGAERFIELGGSGGLPLRTDWLERDSAGRLKLTRLAWRALHAAVKQAAESPATRAADQVEAIEVPTDPIDLTGAVEDQQQQSGIFTRLPDDMAPEVIARYLDLTLDGARAIVAGLARIYRTPGQQAPRALAEAWGISEKSLAVSLSRGAATVRKRWPQYSDLLAALDTVATSYQSDVAADVVLALSAYSRGKLSSSAARDAASDWRSVFGELPLQQRALIVAALCSARRKAAIARRHRVEWRGMDAQRIAQSVARIMAAEQRRAVASAELEARGC